MTNIKYQMPNKKLIHHWPMDIGHWTFSRGFSFIELLVSTTILMVVGTLILTVLFTSLRGVEKAKRLVTLRQNGNFALSQMQKEIRMAKGFQPGTTCSNQMSSITIISGTDDLETTYQCSGTSITSETPLRSSTPLFDSTVVTNSCSFSCGYQSPQQLPYVRISFSLHLADTGTATTIAPPLPFTSTIFLRNSEE